MKYISILLALYSMNIWALSFESGDTKNTLIELYTSQGCSSCPPAERWLGKFEDNDKLFKDIVPIAFHVDYWDNLGWKDQYAHKKHGTHHRLYHSEGSIRALYTPHVIIAGEETRHWRYRVSHEFDKKVGNITVKVEGENVIVTFDKAGFVANVALLGSNLNANITAGENKGRVAEHDFVALGYDAKYTSGNSVTLKLPTTTKDAKLALAVWVSPKNSIKPIQATGAWL